VLAKLDPSAVPNLRFVYDEVKNPGDYGVGILLSLYGIAYNIDKFKQAGIPAPTSWEDLWDPRVAGKVALPDITTVAGRSLVYAVSRLQGGDERSLRKGVEKLAQIKAHSYYNSTVQLETLFPAGDIWIAPMVNGRAWGLIDRGLPIGFVTPKEGAISNLSTIDLVEGTKHRKEALAYIDTVLDPLVQLGQAYEIPYGPVNRLLGPVLANYPDVAKKLVVDPAQLKSTFSPNWDEYRKHQDEVVDLWNKLVKK
jgi:putative spermidine/putrescine transport system substrate-binding protein